MKTSDSAQPMALPMKRFQCEGCDKSYAHKSSLREHRSAKHENKTFGCTRCHLEFAYKSSVVRHLDRNRLRRSLVHCRRTELSSDESTICTNDVRGPQIALIKPFQCLVCSNSYNLKEALRAHYMAAHTDNTFHCERCEKKLPYMSSLAYLLAMRSRKKSPKVWSCSSCNRAYDKFCWYNRHFLTVHAKHVYCSGCMEGGSRTTDREHSRSHEYGCGGKHVSFLCKCCYNVFRVCTEPLLPSSEGGKVIFPCFLCPFYGKTPSSIYEHRKRAHMVCRSCRD